MKSRRKGKGEREFFFVMHSKFRIDDELLLLPFSAIHSINKFNDEDGFGWCSWVMVCLNKYRYIHILAHPHSPAYFQCLNGKKNILNLKHLIPSVSHRLNFSPFNLFQSIRILFVCRLRANIPIFIFINRKFVWDQKKALAWALFGPAKDSLIWRSSITHQPTIINKRHFDWKGNKFD